MTYTLHADGVYELHLSPLWLNGAAEPARPSTSDHDHAWYLGPYLNGYMMSVLHLVAPQVDSRAGLLECHRQAWAPMVVANIVMACAVMAYKVKAYTVLAFTVMAYIVMGYTVVAYTFMAYKVMAYTVLAYTAMAYIVMGCTVMAYTFMAYTVMAGLLECHLQVLYQALWFWST